MRSNILIGLLLGGLTHQLCGMNIIQKLMRSCTQNSSSNLPALINESAGMCGSQCCLNNPEIRRLTLQFPELINECPRYKAMPYWKLSTELLNAKEAACDIDSNRLTKERVKDAMKHMGRGSIVLLGIAAMPVGVVALTGSDYAWFFTIIAEVGALYGFHSYRYNEAAKRKELQEKMHKISQELNQRHVHEAQIINKLPHQ